MPVKDYLNWVTCRGKNHSLWTVPFCGMASWIVRKKECELVTTIHSTVLSDCG